MAPSLRALALLVPWALLLAPLAARPAAAEGGWAPSRDGAWPLQPRPAVAAGFDPPAVRWGSGHRGVDLRGHAGQRVRSALAGTVTFAAGLAGRGVVVVDHGGVRTTYEPVDARVSVGDPVARGAVLGSLQRAGSHCFPAACLHWGLRRGDAYLDPLTLVGAGPVRLLPWASVPGPAAVADPDTRDAPAAPAPVTARAPAHPLATPRAV